MTKTLKASERQLILRVKRFCDLEKANKGPLIPFNQVRSRVAAMTGISEKTVTKITKEGESAASTSTEIPESILSGEKRMKLDDFNLSSLRHEVREIYVIQTDRQTQTSDCSDGESDISRVTPLLDHNYSK